MRKRIIDPGTPEREAGPSGWLDAERIAEVEVSSEDTAYPIESALRPGKGPGWRAAAAGAQVIRLHLSEPLRLRRIRLVFEEHESERSQEFVLRWSADGGRSYQEVVRQQYNFSPPGTTREVEEYEVDLEGASALELRIVPELGGGERRASLAEWRLA